MLAWKWTLHLPDQDMSGHSVSLQGAVSRMATCLRWTEQGRKLPRLDDEQLPLGHGGRATDLEGLTVDEMALLVEVVVHAGMDRDELL